MATVKATGQQPEKNRIGPPLVMTIVVGNVQETHFIYPSSVIMTEDETLSPTEVLAELTAEWNLNEIHGLLHMLDEFHMIPDSLEGSVTIAINEA